ncbi:type IX secretion system plug protein [Mucilaginibacter sp.]
MINKFLTLLLVLIAVKSVAQTPYDNNVFNPNIKTVEFYNTKKEPSFPIINLNSGEQVELAFDDLRGGQHYFYYTIEHCDGDWNSSNLSTTDYLQNFTEDKILDYAYSSATFQKFTHYSVKFPNEYIKPKISGNYILKVYEDDDPTKMILTRKLYVLNSKVSITGEVVTSSDQDKRATNQKINFKVNYGSLKVQNPNLDLRIWVMQNQRDETGSFTTQPQYIRGNELDYGDLTTNDFPGGNEFSHFDTRSLKLNSAGVSHIYRDTANSVVMETDHSRNLPNYTFLYDNDGEYYILNQDAGTNPTIDADYAHMFFSFESPGKTPANGSLYIAGKFNDWKLDDRSKLDYDSKGKFFTHLFLKQGVYDYQYVWVDKATKKPDYITLEGSYFETENKYQLLVYYHPPAARWEELVGYLVLSSVQK